MSDVFDRKIQPPSLIAGWDKAAVNPLPLKGFPEGRKRIRIRPEDIVKVFVVHAGEARCFSVQEEDGHWVPGPELSRNITVTQKS